MANDSFTPEQKQIKHAKAILWIGIIIIVFIGLVIGAYFVFSREGNINNSNLLVNSITDIRCRDWEPGLCEALIGTGYYYSSQTSTCQFSSASSGCSSPPFDTLEECQNTCLDLNTNSVSGNGSIDVSEALADPEEYHNKEICLTGYYQRSFEFSAIGGSYSVDDNGFTSFDGDLVWINVDTPRYECPEYDDPIKGCVQEMTLCGVFKMKGDDGIGFGHLGAYQYVLEPAEETDTSTNSVTTNTNTVSIKDCGDIDNYEECKARQDCNIIDDKCPCATASDRLEKCGQDLPKCATCLGNNFAGCEKLVCDTSTNTNTADSNTNTTTTDANTNTITTNTNTVSIKDCNDVMTKTECQERTDCLPVDVCSCVTDEYWYAKCDAGDYTQCVCDRGGYAVCADLDCSEQPNNNKLLCQWQLDENSDCQHLIMPDRYISPTYYFNSKEGDCQVASGFGPDCTRAPFNSLEECQNYCE